jgi:hypothetical protein
MTSGLSKQYGSIGTIVAGDGVPTAIFPTLDAGVKLQMDQWRRPKYNNLTIDAGCQQWAEGVKKQGYGSPYARDLAKAAGATLDTKVKDLSDEQLKNMCLKQAKWEGWKVGKIVPADPQQAVAESWKDLAVSGAIALGALGAGHSQAHNLDNFSTAYLQKVAAGEGGRAMVSIDDAKAELQYRAKQQTSQQSADTKPAPAKTGFSKTYLQSVVDGSHPRPLISKEKAQELLNQLDKGVEEHKQKDVNCKGVVKIGEGWEIEMANAVGKLLENFADGKNPGRKGLSKRMGVNTKASVSSLRKTAKNSTGEKARMAHWLANMKAGRAKARKK